MFTGCDMWLFFGTTFVTHFFFSPLSARQVFLQLYGSIITFVVIIIIMYWWQSSVKWIAHSPQLTLVSSNQSVFTFFIFNPITTRNDKVGHDTALGTTPIWTIIPGTRQENEYFHITIYYKHLSSMLPRGNHNLPQWDTTYSIFLHWWSCDGKFPLQLTITSCDKNAHNTLPAREWHGDRFLT